MRLVLQIQESKERDFILRTILRSLTKQLGALTMILTAKTLLESPATDCVSASDPGQDRIAGRHSSKFLAIFAKYQLRDL